VADTFNHRVLRVATSTGRVSMPKPEVPWQGTCRGRSLEMSRVCLPIAATQSPDPAALVGGAVRQSIQSAFATRPADTGGGRAHFILLLIPWFWSLQTLTRKSS
jgi:hypothetical protein